MDLYMSENSPYARLARILVRELGVAAQVTEMPVNPRNPETGFWQINPVARIPTLVLADGTAIVESTLICRYLDETLGAGAMHNPLIEKPDRLRLLGLAIGVLDKGMIARVEKARPGAVDTDSFVKTHLAAVERGLDALDAAFADSAAGDDERIDMADIAIATAAGWVSLRHPEIAVCDRKALSRHVDALSHRPAFKETVPPG